MRKTIVISFLLTLFLQGAFAFAKTVPAAKRLKEINRDVWIPFLEGVRKNEESLYLNVHSKIVVK